MFAKPLLAHIEDVRVLQLSNVSLTSQGVIFSGLTPISGLTLTNDNGEIVPYSLWDILKIRLFNPTILLDCGIDYLLIDNIYSHTYYHWVTEALPRLFLLKEKLARAVLLLPNNHIQRFHEEALTLFDVHRIQWLKDGRRYAVPHLISSTQIGKMANYHPVIIKEMVKYFKSKAPQLLDYGEKIYISRGSALKRRVTNELEVESYLESAGFRKIQFEHHSFAEQISIMHHCRVLVGIHGAGLANMIFMEPAGRVMELRKKDNGENYFYFSLASTVDLDYYYQFCDSAVENASVQDADIIVDLEKLKANVKLMLS